MVQDLSRFEPSIQISSPHQTNCISQSVRKGRMRSRVGQQPTKRGGVSAPRQNDEKQGERLTAALKRYFIAKLENKPLSLKAVALTEDIEDLEEKKRAAVANGTLENHKRYLTKEAKLRNGISLEPKVKVPTELLIAETLHHVRNPIGNPATRFQQFFSDDELDATTAWIVDMQILGHKVDAAGISGILNDIADKLIIEEPYLKVCKPSFSTKWVKEKFLKRPAAKALNLKERKHSPIDPKRAAQAKQEVGEAFFANVNGFLERKHGEDPGLFKHSKIADIPADKSYYADEFGSNTNEKNGKVVGTDNYSAFYFGSDSDITEDPRIERIQRQYQVTEGDNGQGFHTSVFEFTRADGAFREQDPSTGKVTKEGAPCSVIIHQLPSGGQQALSTVARSEDNPSATAASGAAKKNVPEKSGYLVLQTKNGSQTRESFMECARHFVSQLPRGQGGKDGEMVYLYVDGHTSRWNLTALYYLRENNVTVICIPAHCSIWAAPNDAGGNRAIKTYNGEFFIVRLIIFFICGFLGSANILLLPNARLPLSDLP